MTENLDNPRAYSAAEQTVDDTPNRGLDVKLDNSDQSPITITVMSIDETIINYLKNVIKPSITDNGTVRLVPVIYGTPERWATFRKDGIIRDPKSGKAQTPIIMIKHTSVTRGTLSNPVNKYIETSWESGWNRRNAYDKWAVLNNIVPSREFRAVIIPDYVDITYEIIMWTEYEEQMSELLGQIQVETDDFWGSRNGFKFRVRIDSFDSQSELEATEDRVVRMQCRMKVGAYLIPEKMVKAYRTISTNKKFYTVKKVVEIVEIDGQIIDP